MEMESFHALPARPLILNGNGNGNGNANGNNNGNGNGQEQDRSGAPSADEVIVDVPSADEECADSPSTVRYGFVYVMRIDNAEFNNRMGIHFLENLERSIIVFPDHWTPPFRVKNEDIGACFRFGAWERVEQIIIALLIALLSVALQALLQTNLPTTVTYCLLIAAVFAFSYLLLFAPRCFKKHTYVTYAAHVWFGITTFAMALAAVLQARDLSKS